MHEIGVMIEVVKTVEKFAKQNGVTKVQTLVLQIGELSTVVPRYIKACYPAAIEGTLLEDTQLQIEIMPGNAICDSCNKVFNILENKSVCPYCNSKNWEMLSGKEFNIKEIVAC